MAQLTIFSTPKPFSDPHIATIQRNAVQSWLCLGPDVEVILVGEEDGLEAVAQEYHVPVLARVARNASGTPLVSSIFSLASEVSNSPFMVFVNSDIILMRDLVIAAQDVSSSLRENGNHSQKKPFLVIGQRWDLEVLSPLEFSSGWEKHLIQELKERGQLHAPAGSDYFIFPRGAFSEIPGFAIGRAGWDNWMIYHARKQHWPVIDATPSIKIVHQNHDYRHLPEGKPHYNQVESQVNLSAAGGLSHMYMVLDSTHQLVDGQVRRAPLTRMRMIRAFERWLMPEKDSLRGLRGGLARKFRRMRRGVD